VTKKLHNEGRLSWVCSEDSRAEKPARGALFTALQRVMGPDKIVIADGMNYIKGFRYQMYCAAREFKLRVCTVRRLVTPGIFLH
jgi:protein KTI12